MSLSLLQARKSSPGGATPQSNSSFQAYGFGASGAHRAAALHEGVSPAGNMSRRGSHVNVNITPSSAAESNTPEIRRFTKRLGSDILCGSLWGE